MYSSTTSYHIRMFELLGLRRMVIPRLDAEFREWNRTHVAWQESTESCLEWMIKEAIERAFNAPVIDHYKEECGRYMLDQIQDFGLLFGSTIAQISLTIMNVPIQHIKVMVLGDILITAVRYR